MQPHPLSPVACAASLWRHRSLVHTLTRRDVVGRYRGSVLGILWSLFHPILMLAVYTFVFGVVFKAQWFAGGTSRTGFALELFAGLLVFNLFAECVNRAPGLVLAHAGYVKKVAFPLEVLPWVSLGSALFHFMAGLLVWIAFHLCFFGLPRPGLLLLPVVLAPLFLGTLGVSWLLASLGVYLRDLGQITGIATTVLMFLSPVFYPLTALPPQYRFLLVLNPLTPVIENARAAMTGAGPSIDAMFVMQLVASVLLAWLGFAWFQKTRKGFADVL
jgi:lipopolysaccharide transport system permease protein